MAKQDYSLLTTLKDIFPAESWSWAIPSLKREPLVWERLQGEHFREKARKEIGTQPQKWTPARLGVIALNLDLPFRLRWPLPPFNEVDPELRQRVYKKYQTFTNESPQVANLTQALLLSLGLKQEKDAGMTWEELLQGSFPPATWRGPLVCLYEILDSPAALLKVLPDRLGLHIALSRPTPPAAHRERLRGHLSLFPRSKQVGWLEILKEDNPGMASRLAKTLTSNSIHQPSTIADILTDSELYQAADDPHSALQMLKEASSLHQELKGKLSAKINAANAMVEAPHMSSQAWQDLLETAGDPVQLAAHADVISDLLRILIEKKFHAAAENLIERMKEPLPEHPDLLSNLARFALSQDEPENARRLALQALDLGSDESPAPLSEILLDLNLFEEAIQAANSTLSVHPTHQKTLTILAKAQDKVGDHPHAIDHAQLAVLLKPDEIDLRRQLASYLEHNHEWGTALKERSSVMAKLQGDIEAKSTFEPTLPKEDLHALANCAYHAEQPARAVKVCENILAENPDDGLAHATLGKSLRVLGDDEEGFKHLEKATHKAPELADPWLALAEGYAERGETENAIQTLKMGTSAAGQGAKIYLALGKLHQHRQAQSEALEAFQKSAQLAQEESVDDQTEHEIGYQLGKTYYHLGHLKKARNTLRDLKERYPGNQKTHYIYGQILLDMDEPRGALPYLAQVVDTAPQDAVPYIDYADAHLRIGANPKIAIKTLDQALQKAPDNEKAQALLAEAYAANEEYDRALSQFQKVFDSELCTDPIWGPRITIGFGTTALNLGQTETALATLNEGFQANPHHLTLAQTLAEAYAKADLRNDALNTARQVLDIAPDDMNNLEWVSGFALDLDSPQHAIPALQEMTHLEPNRTATYIQLGKAYRQNDDTESAREVFSKISSLDNATPDGLYQAGDALLRLGDIEPGMNCLEKAANISHTNDPADPLLPEIWARQADGHAMNGNAEKALDLLDQAIAADLDQPKYRVKKADLLVDEERYQAALASLKNALDINPQDPSLHYKTALLHRQVGNLPSALEHARRAVDLEVTEEASRVPPQAISLASDLAWATAQPDMADRILHEGQDELFPPIPTNQKRSTDALCLRAELALKRDEGEDVPSILNEIMEEQKITCRVSALQARVLARQGNVAKAHTILDQIEEDVESGAEDPGLFASSYWLGIARAFKDLGRWVDALVYYRKAAQASPQDLRAHLEWIRTLVHRAEGYRFAQALEAIHHTPGPEALSRDARDEFRQVLGALKDLTEDTHLYRRWELRGGAVFQKNLQAVDALEDFAESPQNLAALLAALRHHHRGDQAAKRAIGTYDKIGKARTFDAQVALSILHINPSKALEAANSALDISRDTYDPGRPFYHILKALAAEKDQDVKTAHQSVLDALEVWEDEPRWHALAAKFCQSAPGSISHLERAIELEPSYAGHYLDLGNALIKNNELLPAIEALEEAVSKNPELTAGWISLARCYRKLGNLAKTMECALQAVEGSPGNVQARMMVAEIALEEGKYPLAEKHLGILMDHNAQNPQVLALLSQTLAAQGRPQDALKVIGKAIPLSKDPLELKLQRAELIKDVEGASAAVDALRVLGSHYPDHYRVVTALVKALAEGGEIDQAISTAKTVLSKDDVGHTSSQKARLHLLTGRLLRNAGQLDQALHHLNQAKKLDPTSHEAYLELGRTHLDRRQYDRALERLNKAIELAPDKAMGYFYAGKVLKELKHYDRAERMLRQASKLAPNDLRVHRQLGVLVTLNLVHGSRKKEEAIP